MITRVWILFFVLLVQKTFGQSIPTCYNESGLEGKTYISLPANTDFFLYRKKNIVGKEPTFQGYRIQIFISQNKMEAMNTKRQFENQFPDLGCYVEYVLPEFKLRVGNFRNKWEAIKALKTIKETYSTAIIVPDEVKFPKL